MSQAVKIGLALAGGGPEGALYEIGALRALEESLEGLDFNDLDIYVGVSAGAFVGACLANGITLRHLCRVVASEGTDEGPFAPENFFAPAFGELRRRLTMVPGLFAGGLWDFLRKPDNFSFLEPVLRLGRALPVGVFDSRRIADYLEKVFDREGRSNDFRSLKRSLIIVAADLDSGRAVRFGEPGWDHIPISTAVQASSALPGFFEPVTIDGRHYVDGVLIKTVHASTALKAGADLLLAVNPIVPVDTAKAVEEGVMVRGKLVDRGLPAVLSQTLRTLIRSRLEAGIQKYATKYADSEIQLFEPRRDDFRMFFTNIFSFSDRRAVCEHAYQRTREHLLSRQDEIAAALEPFGVGLRRDLLREERSLWDGIEVSDDLSGRLHSTLDRLQSALDSLQSRS
ncbi:MAG: patatin-like phospholipase family protein [Acidobacteriota bacterium]